MSDLFGSKKFIYDKGDAAHIVKTFHSFMLSEYEKENLLCTFQE